MSLVTIFRRTVKAIGVLSIVSSIAYAQALTVSPARIELSGDPGTVVTDEFLLINEQDSEQTYYTSAENFEARGESGTPSFTTGDTGLASWVEVQEKVTLKKGERAKIPFSISIPKDADAGGQFAAIFLSTVPPSTKAGEVSVGVKVGTLLLVRVNGDVKEGGGVLSFGLKDGKHFLVDKPIDFTYRFNNAGNDRINPTGEIVIRNMIGMQTATINANPTSGNILPSSTRRFDVAWGDETRIDPQASFFEHVAYEWRNFAFGVYRATMSLSFGSSGVSKSSALFFVFPWHLLIVIVILILAVLKLLQVLIKKYNRWIIKQAQAAR